MCLAFGFQVLESVYFQPRGVTLAFQLYGVFAQFFGLPLQYFAFLRQSVSGLPGLGVPS